MFIPLLLSFFFVSEWLSNNTVMNNINELLQAVYISLLVTRFLLNSSRVLKAIELLKECLILFNNKALKKFKVLVTPYKSIYHQMFNGYLRISDWPNAIECGRKLLVLLRESGERDKEEEVNVTFRLAELHQKQGKYQEAKKCYEEALSITKDTGDREGEAVSNGKLGFVCHHLGEYAKAKKYHEKALAFTKEIGDRGYEASCYINLGNVFQSLGGKEKAKQYYEKALAIATDIGNREKEASCYRNLGSVSGSLGDYTKAKEYCEKALAIATEIGNRGHKAFCYQNLGTVFRILGENARAREYHEKALAIAKEIGDRKQESCCYERLGAVFHVLGKYDTAKEYHEKGLTIAKEIGDGKNKASCYRGLGNVFTSVGDYVKAKENYEKALAIAKEIGERGEEVSCNRYLGTVFLHLGEYAKAKTFYENALAMAKEISDGKSEDVCRAVCYGDLGTMFCSLGEHAKAKEYQEIALTITKKIGDRQKEANCYGELGSVFGSLGEYAKAREFYEKALAIAKEIGDRKKEGTFYGNLGVLFHYLGEYAKAKKYYDKVLVMSKEIGCIKLEQATHANFAMTLLLEGNMHEAQLHLLASIDKFESIRSFLTGYDQLNISLFDENVLAYQILGSLFCVTGNPVQALYVVELGRARALADLMSAQYSIENKVSVNPQTRVGIANIMKNESNCTCLYISYYAEMIYLWTFKGDKPIRFRKIDVDHCFVHKASTRSVDEVLGAKTFRQLHLLAEEQCEDRSWFPSNVIRPTCKSSQEDSLAASRLVEKEEYENQQPDPTLAECYKMIIAPVADLLDEAEIIIVPDRCFFKVPFTALEDESRNCLSETFRIRIIPSDVSQTYSRKSNRLSQSDWCTDSRGS